MLVVFAALSTVLTAGPAAAHGAPTSPVSRASACGSEGTKSESSACRAALEKSPALAVQWDNVRLPDVNGRDREAIPDGKLCSAGLTKFAGLDLPRADWPSTKLTAGAAHTFSYRATIPHEGTFRVYVTRDGYINDLPLTWADLEPEPFLSVTDPELVDDAYTFDGTLPDGLTGKRLIYTIWQNSSTDDTYYSCSDVDFGTASSGGAVGSSDAPTSSDDPAADGAAADGSAADGSAADGSAAGDPATDGPATGGPAVDRGRAPAGEAGSAAGGGTGAAMTALVDLQTAVLANTGLSPVAQAAVAAVLLVGATVGGATLWRRRRDAAPAGRARHRSGS